MGILGPTHKTSNNSSNNNQVNIVEGSLERYGQGNSNLLKKKKRFQNLGFGTKLPYLEILSPKHISSNNTSYNNQFNIIEGSLERSWQGKSKFWKKVKTKARKLRGLGPNMGIQTNETFEIN